MTSDRHYSRQIYLIAICNPLLGVRGQLRRRRLRRPDLRPPGVRAVHRRRHGHPGRGRGVDTHLQVKKIKCKKKIVLVPNFGCIVAVVETLVFFYDLQVRVLSTIHMLIFSLLTWGKHMLSKNWDFFPSSPLRWMLSRKESGAVSRNGRRRNQETPDERTPLIA